jgi:hypothetical protein
MVHSFRGSQYSARDKGLGPRLQVSAIHNNIHNYESEPVTQPLLSCINTCLPGTFCFAEIGSTSMSNQQMRLGLQANVYGKTPSAVIIKAQHNFNGSLGLPWPPLEAKTDCYAFTSWLACLKTWSLVPNTSGGQNASRVSKLPRVRMQEGGLSWECTWTIIMNGSTGEVILHLGRSAARKKVGGHHLLELLRVILTAQPRMTADRHASPCGASALPLSAFCAVSR